MNIPLQFTWRFDQIPSMESLEQRSSLSKELLIEHLDQPVPPFVVTLPMYLAETMRFRTYIDQAHNGLFAPRSTMLYPNTILTRIRRNKLEIDWD
jgi:hypothetical protein